jgi:hypothetical protein
MFRRIEREGRGQSAHPHRRRHARRHRRRPAGSSRPRTRRSNSSSSSRGNSPRGTSGSRRSKTPIKKCGRPTAIARWDRLALDLIAAGVLFTSETTVADPCDGSVMEAAGTAWGPMSFDKVLARQRVLDLAWRDGVLADLRETLRNEVGRCPIQGGESCCFSFLRWLRALNQRGLHSWITMPTTYTLRSLPMRGPRIRFRLH